MFLRIICFNTLDITEFLLYLITCYGQKIKADCECQNALLDHDW